MSICRSRRGALLFLIYPLSLMAAPPDVAFDRTQLPIPPAAFTGQMGRTLATSKGVFPAVVTAPAGAPNVLLILTDDVGFGAASTFGGAIPTPNLDRLAASGLRYNRFHTTAMCSPTRAALLTGRNHHAVGAGTVAEMSSGFPGYSSLIPRSAATVAEILRLNGYNTSMFGKHHNTPLWQTSAAGPFDQWPTGLGFEYFYGFLGGDTNQWDPKVYRNTTPVSGAAAGSDPHLLDRDLADEVVHWIHNQKAAAPDKPFFVYYAPGSTHAPHQAPREWITRFRGQFDAGWDRLREATFERQKSQGIIPANARLSPRPASIPAWQSLSADQQRVYARMMEVYAAMLAYQDDQVGRVLHELERMGLSDNTLVMFIEGDNGASPEGGLDGSQNEIGSLVNGVQESVAWRLSILDDMGGPQTYQLLPVGWSWAMDTPFQWTKQVASHLGGTRNGLVVSWPAVIKDHGGMRSQFGHVIDVLPTLLEAAQLPLPTRVNGAEQQPVEGVSLLYTFAAAATPERHTTQYFEMIGNRAIYHDGWMANTTPARLPWVLGQGSVPVDQYTWELYDLNADFSQSRDLARQRPDKLRELESLFWQEAARNQALPLDDRQGFERAYPATANYAPRRDSYVYWGKDISVAQMMAPPLAAHSFSLVANIVVPAAGAQGVIAATGSHFAGWSFYCQDGRPIALQAFSQRPEDQFRVASVEPLPPGPALLRYDFDYDGGGPGRGGTLIISVNGREVARGRVERSYTIVAGLGETFDTGRDTGAPVADYVGEAPFDGEIERLEVVTRK